MEKNDCIHECWCSCHAEMEKHVCGCSCMPCTRDGCDKNISSRYYGRHIIGCHKGGESSE